MFSDFIKAILLGIIEGLTEFLPVSSTGHLIIVGDLLNFTNHHSATFDIAIQLGAIMAVVVLYRQFFYDTFQPSAWLKPNMIKIIIAIVPALTLAFFSYGFIKRVLFSSNTVVIGLIVGSIIMILVERFFTLNPSSQSIDDITYRQALIIGLAQCFSLWPGTSRSGSTIVGGLLSGLSYECSARFSFIIAVPVMLAAVSYDLLKSYATLSVMDFQLILTGLIVSFIVALFAIQTFIACLTKFKLFPFAIYRIILALIVIIL